MNLPIPVPGQTSGPQWAQDINASLTLIDQHNHTAGSGVQIPPAGLNINTALTFNNNSATGLMSSIYTPQVSYTTDYGVHVEGVDLYYVDGNGNDIQITSGGTVNATSSGISSGTATASFSGSPAVLVVNAASSTPANIQGGSILIGNNTANSKFLTLAPPSAMAANIQETLPTIPASQSFLTMDTSGNIANYASINQGISRTNQVAVGQQISSSSGVYSTTSGTFGTVTNLNVTITTSGRPVELFLMPVSGSSAAGIEVYATATSVSGELNIQSTNASSYTTLGIFSLGITGATSTLNTTLVPPGTIHFLDTPASGTWTYRIQALAFSGATLQINNCVLVAYEL